MKVGIFGSQSSLGRAFLERVSKSDDRFDIKIINRKSLLGQNGLFDRPKLFSELVGLDLILYFSVKNTNNYSPISRSSFVCSNVTHPIEVFEVAREARVNRMLVFSSNLTVSRLKSWAWLLRLVQPNFLARLYYAESKKLLEKQVVRISKNPMKNLNTELVCIRMPMIISSAGTRNFRRFLWLSKSLMFRALLKVTGLRRSVIGGSDCVELLLQLVKSKDFVGTCVVSMSSESISLYSLSVAVANDDNCFRQGGWGNPALFFSDDYDLSKDGKCMLSLSREGSIGREISALRS